MSLSAQIVGYRGPLFEHLLDARWSMAYAASLNDMSPLYFDNTAQQTLHSHPLFPVCVEWPAIVESLETNHIPLGGAVHATHDLHIVQPMSPPAGLVTRATIIGLEQRRPGAYLSWRIDTHDKKGELLSRTWQGNLFLGQQLTDGERVEQPLPELPAAGGSGESVEIPLELSANLAHTYTECARIWNPIHTDAKVAKAAGLGQPLLHGTASLALATSAIVREMLDGNPSTVTRVGGRFAAMVLLPSTVALLATKTGDVINFELLTSEGKPAIAGGFVCTQG